MRVLVACEVSQKVTNAFRVRGHEAYSCDILPTEGNPDWHIQGDAFDYIWQFWKWDMLIAHPVCTRLCNSGVRWLHERNLWDDMNKACEFFNRFRRCNIRKKCIENPIPHKYAVRKIGKYSQIIQHWQFGHPETKATCLWLEELPKLKPTNIVAGREQRIWKLPPSKDRSKLRSETFSGIADAMAEQWG